MISMDFQGERATEFRAEVYKTLAYFFASFTGLTLLQIFVFGKNPYEYYNISIAAYIVFSIIAAQFLIARAYVLKNEIDRKDKFKEKK